MSSAEKSCRAYGTRVIRSTVYPAFHAGLDYDVRFADSYRSLTLHPNEDEGQPAWDHRSAIPPRDISSAEAGCRAYGTQPIRFAVQPSVQRWDRLFRPLRGLALIAERAFELY